MAGTVNNWIGASAASAASPWAFTGNAGISGNNSAFTSGNPAAPDGAQAAYLKTDTTQSSISQTVYLNAGTYDIGLLAAQHRSVNTANQQIVVSVTQGAATVESAVIAPSGTTYVHYQTPQFVIDAAGFYTIGLAGGDTPGKGVDSTALVDAGVGRARQCLRNAVDGKSDLATDETRLEHGKTAAPLEETSFSQALSGVPARGSPGSGPVSVFHLCSIRGSFISPRAAG